MGELMNQLRRNIEDNAQPRDEIAEIRSEWHTQEVEETDPDLNIPRFMKH